MENMLLTIIKTVLLYVAALAAFYISNWLNPHADDAGIGQSLLVAGAVAAVLLSAILYAFYKAITQNSQWWIVVGLHLALTAVSLVWMMR